MGNNTKDRIYCTCVTMIHFYLVGKERFIGSLLGQIVYIIVSSILTKIVQIVKKNRIAAE